MDLCEPVTPYSSLSGISQYEGQSTFCILIMFPITKSIHVHFLTQSSLHVSKEEMSHRSELQEQKFGTGINSALRSRSGWKPLADTHGGV